jgi:DNA repair protein RecN (Recombination protein N)
MLISLSIRNIVIIEKLDLSFDRGLGVLTGETGAGKSILLDSLGFALGNRADAGLLRPGAEQASVTAVFDVAADHPARALLAEQGLEAEDQLLLRRVLTQDGRSRAYVNDQAASAGLLRQLADSLIEIQGQFDQRGLMDPATHRVLLDAYGRLKPEARALRELWRAWQDALTAREAAAKRLAEAQRDEAFLRHAVEELDALDPRPGEEAGLAEKRNRLMHREKLVEGVNAALGEIASDDGGGAEPALGRALRILERIAPTAGKALAPALEALQRAALEAEEAMAQLNSYAGDMELDADTLEAVEERYFALQDMARKHHTAVDALPALRGQLAERLAAIDGGEAELTKLAEAAAAARRRYQESAEALSKKRAKAAAALDKAVMAELPPLKLERALFRTALERLEEGDWSAQGLDRIAFEVATNPGSVPGPLGRIASGGELARFLLAIKVVLASVNPERSLVFDEVDSGVGGATAHAVGERLERLARDRQVLVITHSPQVAARGAQHWQVLKQMAGKQVATQVSRLDAGDRREEIARMLSGAEITEEARAAAERLIGAS